MHRFFLESNMTVSPTIIEYAVIIAEKIKRRKYADLMMNDILIPVAVETAGIASPAASRLLYIIGDRLYCGTSYPNRIYALS